MDDSIDSGNFSVIGYLPLIEKDSDRSNMSYCKSVTDLSVTIFLACGTPSFSGLKENCHIGCIKKLLKKIIEKLVNAG